MIVSADERTISTVKAAILKQYEGRDLGPLSEYLNIKFERDRSAKTIKLSQPRHISELQRGG